MRLASSDTADMSYIASILGLLAASLMGHVVVDIAPVDIWTPQSENSSDDDFTNNSATSRQKGLILKYMLKDPLCYHIA